MEIIQSQPVAEPTQNDLNGGFLNKLRELTVGSGSTIFRTTKDGSWWGSATKSTAPAQINMDGSAVFTSITINGLDGATIAGAINSSGNFVKDIINDRFNTSTKQILGEFTFGASGAIAIATDANNGIWLSPTGLLGKKAGNTTFAIGIDGTATFGGTLVAAGGTLGTITSGTITGSVVQTATSGYRIKLNNSSNKLEFLNGDTVRGSIFIDSTGDINISGTDDVEFYAGGSKRCGVYSGSFKPDSDRAYDLGSDANQWDNVYADRYFAGSSGTGGLEGPVTYGFLTALRISGSAGTVDLDGKYREITIIGGIVTAVSSESSWVDLDTASGI
jgi:hypothetical protein